MQKVEQDFALDHLVPAVPTSYTPGRHRPGRLPPVATAK